MNSINDLIAQTNARRSADAARWDALDDEQCMLCPAHGADKRTLLIRCMYAMQDVIPEAMDLYGVETFSEDMRGWGFFGLLICKSCRARLLHHLKQWRDECIALRGRPVDHDGYLLDEVGP